LGVFSCCYSDYAQIQSKTKNEGFQLNCVNTIRIASMKLDQAGLIAACKDGDEGAITQLVQEHQLGVFRLALSVLNDPVEANDVTQDTFIAALRALHAYQERSTFKAWLYRIALNISRSRLRKRKALESLHHTITALFRIQSQRPPTLEEQVISSEDDAALWQALSKLGERQRIPIVLRYYHDLSIAEIAEILNIKEGTVHSRLSIGRNRLRSELKRHFPTRGV
jgi:RNA polymerase sigma-70 factor (ECF subfamily)